MRSVPVPDSVTFAGNDAVPSDHPIDRFIHAKLQSRNFRRLCGQIDALSFGGSTSTCWDYRPAPETVAGFVADNDPQSYENLVDTLLQSQHFGERWTRHWLDIAHYADTHGFERDKRRDHAWRYRDYVIQSFNADKPYDQFLREQIAGDVMGPHNDEAVVATGFWPPARGTSSARWKRRAPCYAEPPGFWIWTTW